MKKILKWSGITVGALVALFVLLGALVYFPPVQNFLVKKAAEVASEELGLKVTLDRVRLSFPLDLTLENFVAMQGNDTLLAAGELTAQVEALPLFHEVVNVNGLDLRDVKVNTLDWIDACVISGTVPHFYLYSHGINLKPETVVVNEALLDGARLCIALNDSVPEDTVPSEPTTWQVLLEQARLKDSHLQLLMDSMDIRLGFGDAQVQNTSMDLKENLYQVAHAHIEKSRVAVDLVPGQPAQGLDYNHLVLDSLNLTADSIVSQGSYLSVNLRKGNFCERSGLRAQSLTGKIQLDSLSIHAHDLHLKTPYSTASLEADVDYASLDDKGSGLMDVHLDANIGKQDVLYAVGEDLAKDITDVYPSVPLLAQVNVEGNMQKLRIWDTHVQAEGMLTAQAEGTVYNTLDDHFRNGTIDLNARTGDVTALMKMLDLGDYTIPQGTTAVGKLGMAGPRYSFDGRITERKGVVDMKAWYNTQLESYEADVVAQQVNIHDFMPKDSLFLFSGSVNAKGRGTDFFSKQTVAEVHAQVDQFQYTTYDVNGIGLDAQLQDNLLQATATADNPYLQLTAGFNGVVRADSIGGRLNADVQKADLLRLGVFEKKNDLSLHLEAEGGYDFDDDITADVQVNQITMDTEKRKYSFRDLAAQAFLNRDTISLHAAAGDFEADLHTRSGLDSLLVEANRYYAQLEEQQKSHSINALSLKQTLPEFHLEVNSGRNNPLCNFLLLKGYGYRTLHACVDTDKEKGINADAYLYAFKADSLQLDTIRFSLFPSEDNLRFSAQVRNNRKNPDFVFNALVNGTLMEDGAAARLQYFDEHDVQGVDMGIRAQLEQNGYRFTFRPDRPLIAYHTFNLTPEDAYIFIRDDMQVSGNMSLLTDEGMGIVFQADPEEDEQQCMKMDLHDINLEEISQVVPYMPRMTGLLSGKLHAHQPMGGAMQADGQLAFKDLTYEDSAMGDIDLDLAYTPSGEDTHTVNMAMKRNGMLVTQLSGTYTGSTGAIQMDAQLIRFPAEIVNGFIPDHMFGLRGIMEGKFKLTGDTNYPIVNGTIATDSVYIFSDMYNLNLRVQNKEMPIENSRFSMKDFTLYSEKNDELVANGWVDFANLEKIRVDCSMRARNFQVIDQPRNLVSQLYGRAYVNLNATVRGLLEELVVRGTLELLGSTDVTYVLKDTPITVEDRLNDLVTFVEFADTASVQQQIERKELSGMDLVLNLNISEGARVNCDLSANRESYVQLQGGGNLIFKYTPEGEMLLNGRYSINGGEMKYALPVIPLKTFTLGDGSYVQFNGEIMNPTLNITAIEQTRASVSSEGSSPRNVLFNVGVKITQTLENMGLEFTIEAPEDMTISNELASFSKETRGKLAVTMLATGLYMSENSGNVTMSSALNSFLQSEISSIAGNALKSIDLSVGMEDGTASDGSNTTDYSFRFAKRLWNNRVSIIVGGKVSTGANANASDSFIDDISIEYRLDDSGTRYVKLFHEKNFDSLLDGEVTETGGGVVLRKKMTRFGELFIFRSRKKREAMIQERERRREQREEKERNERTE